MRLLTTVIAGLMFGLHSLGAAEQVPAPASQPAIPVQIGPAAWLKTQPKPAFKVGHTLPRLTRFGWSLPLDGKIEVTENWGYAFEFPHYLGMEIVQRLDDPNSEESRMAALVKADPKRFPIAVIIDRRLPGDEAPPETWVRDKDGKVLNGQAKSMDGNTWSEAAGAIFSPEAPPIVWKLAGKYRADPLIELQKRGVPVSIVLNGGEYGIPVLGFAQPIWSQDPKIVAAVNADPFKGNWQDYFSYKKSASEKIIADEVRAATPKRDLYVYYTAGGGTLRNKYWGQYDWQCQWKHERGISDLPSHEVYYKHYNDGFTGRLNLLSCVLNAVSLEIASGDNVSYNWICAGWERGNAAEMLADLTRWTGFLKCYYTAGMVGANIGYYEFPAGGFNASFPATKPPVWLQQMAASGYVHALFSQVEDLVRKGDLLPGPMQHAISPSESAFEFPTGDDTARVLVRKHRTSATWLVTAWASDGADRQVEVRVPELGRIKVNARVCGSVYRATLAKDQVTLVQLDAEGSTYTKVQNSAPVVKTVDLSVAKPSAENLVLWLAADTGVTKEVDGSVSAWKSQGTPALTFTQPDAKHRPQWVANALRGKPALRIARDKQWLAIPLIDIADKKYGANLVGDLTIFGVFHSAADKGNRNNRIISATAATGHDYEQGITFTDGGESSVPADAKEDLFLKLAGINVKSPLKNLCIGAMCWGGGGGMGGNGFGFGGDLAELLVYKGGLPPTTAALVMDYLNDKYQPAKP